MPSAGLYLHIPFCDGKCAYCDFFSRRADEAQLNMYTEKMIGSIYAWSKKVHRMIDTVYFGGGTPSLLGHERLTAILKSIYGAFDVAEGAEITVEVNPSSTGELDFAALREAGFNRLSIGMQSAHDNELRILGRRHSAADARHTVERAQQAGFDNISLDVMLAVPEQTTESLAATLDFCASCRVQHISAYILKIEEGTRFYTMKDRLALFSDDEQAALYEQAAEYLERLGYRQYEISNFAFDGYQSRHNLHYWHDDEYLGLGPSAHSFLDGRRFYFDRDIEGFYHDRILYESEGGDSEEYIMLALRLTEGLVFERYESRFGRPIGEKLKAAAKSLQTRGLCEVTEQNIRLTVKGFLVSNSVIAYLSENT